MATPSPEQFTIQRGGTSLAGEVEVDREAVDVGVPVVLAHGITATRRYVVHGSHALPRKGHRMVSYDSRAHGESDPAPEGEGYSYAELAGDLGRVIEDRVGEEGVVLAGHSMGAHTVVAFALENPDRVAGLVVIGPVYMGLIQEEYMARWDALADGLERDGVEGFMAAYDPQVEPAWREVVMRITRERLSLHRHLAALARALRETTRSRPFEAMSELEFLDVPALVVASHDEADPGHPRAVAEAYAEALPSARLIGEPPGDSPLAWQGGRLSREIAAFCAEPAVRERTGG